ncbi:TonB-dependent receptor [Geothrix sp. 21YS21S-4]|uniref:TonB-dependent receptor n=1 Tax=Geothrix sp. 21YS21S-4 TaxID=3068889 RepID=UPI0027BA6A0E|nr:TonB-dependent receptor [Geothrix sp. 21YS21S-4]
MSTSTLAALLVAAAPLMSQGVSAQLGGRVLDTKGAGLAGATVTIRNTETGLTRTTQTNADGRYLATLLPVGPYSVTVTKAGFQTASNVKVNLNLGDAAPLTIKLASETGAVVEVIAAASQVDSERASAAAIVSPDNLTNLPVLNRNFTNLATLAPQVVVDSSRGNLAIAGQRGVNTSINIDGGDNNEPFFGGATGAAEGKTPFTISIEAIREYQVVTDGASAEFGRMGGGYVNAITKNGTNDFSGSVFYYQRPKGWVEAGPTLRQPTGSFTTNPVGDFQQEQFGFSIGGPIVKDKLFFFAAYDAQRRKDPINMVWGGNSPVTLDPVANPNDAVLVSKLGSYAPKSDSDVYFLRFDWNPTIDHNIQFRINHSDFKGATGASTMAAYENLATDNVKTDSYVLQWNWVISANWMSEFRATQTKDDMPRSTYSNIPEVSISNVGYYGAYPFDRTYNTKRTEYQENVSYVTPTFQLKAGLDYNAIDVSEFFAGNWQGVYSFSNLANFRAGNWSYYRQNFSLMPGQSIQQAGLFDTSYKQMAAFIQTSWRLTDTFKLDVGVRWDRQENPDYPILDMSNRLATSMPVTAKIPSDSQYSPRLSFTWTPGFDQGKTVVRGSVGRYVSTTPAVFFYQVYAANGVRTGSKDFQPTEAATYGIPRGTAFNAANPLWLSSTPTGFSTFNIWTFDKNFKNPYTDRVNLGAERSFFNDLVLGLSATYAKGNQLERTADVNLGTPVPNASGRLIYPSTISAAGAYTAVRPNAAYGTMGVYYSDATSLYHAYTASLKYHKDGSAFDAQLFYTYAINKDSDSNERNYSGVTIQDPASLGNQWGYADTDRRQVLTGYFSFLDKNVTGILTSVSVRYQTGTPYTLTYTADVNGDGNSTNDRYFQNGVDTGRNTQRIGSTLTLDLGLRRDIPLSKGTKLTLSADVFNLLNRQDTYFSRRVSYTSPVTPATVDANSASNLQPQQNWIGSARQVQVGARFSF